jgi:hypothetical protein
MLNIFTNVDGRRQRLSSNGVRGSVTKEIIKASKRDKAAFLNKDDRQSRKFTDFSIKTVFFVSLPIVFELRQSECVFFIETIVRGIRQLF